MFESTDKIDQWFTERWGRFTASECYKLMAPGAKTTFATGGDTYIETKALEMCTHMVERPEMEEVKSLLWGKMYELPAYQAYVQATKNHSMTYMGSESPIFLVYEPLKEEVGGTPDVGNITNDGKMDYLCEIKCPKNPAFHFRRLSWKSQWDLKENYPLVYAQIQMLLMITDAFGCDFVSFDDRQILKSKKIKIIEVKPDLTFINNLDLRLRKAIQEKYKLISTHFGMEIKNQTEFKTILKRN